MQVGIIGGGIYGTAIAYFLRRRSDHDVIVFEKNAIGGESTSRSAGIVRQHYPRPGHVEIAARGRKILESFARTIGGDIGFHRNGYLTIGDKTNAERIRKTVTSQQDLGLNVEFVEPNRVQEHVPGLSLDNIAVAALEHQAGFADPYLVVQELVTAGHELGVEYCPDTEVRDVLVNAGTVTAVKIDDEMVDVDYLVNAGGPLGADVAAMVGVDVPLTWHESKVVVLRADEPYGVDMPTVSDADRSMYAKPEPGGDFIVGGVERPAVDRERGLEGVDLDYLDLIYGALKERLPGYADAEVVESWSGIITSSPDWYQVIGIPEGYENFYNAVGGSGHGFKEATAFAESIAADIDGDIPRFDLQPYRLGRFADGEHLDDMEESRKE